MNDYLFQLNEQLRHTLNNLDDDNLSANYQERIADIQEAARAASRQAGTLGGEAGQAKEAATRAQAAAESARQQAQEAAQQASAARETAEQAAATVAGFVPLLIRAAKWTGERYEMTAPVDAATLTPGQLMSLHVDAGAMAERVLLYPVSGAAVEICTPAGDTIPAGGFAAGWHLLRWNGTNLELIQ